MTNATSAIIIDLGRGGSADAGQLLGGQALVNGAVASLKGSLIALRQNLGRAAEGVGRVARASQGLLSALMQTATVASGLERGMANLYRYAKAYDRRLAGSMDELATAALYLRNSLAAMTAPLITSAAPAVDYIADRFVSMFNTVSQLFARLAGAETYTAARRFGDAWDSEAGRVRGAVSAVRRYVLGFDELNVLGGAGGSGGSGGGGGYAAMFEERPIEGGIAAFADRLREAFEAGDWRALGVALGEKLDAALEGIDWSGLGHRVGYYLNGAIETAYHLLDTVNFTRLGGRIAEFLNAALTEIDFEKAGATVALFFTSLVETFAGFVGKFDWRQFARRAAQAVNGFAATLGERLDAVDWAKLTRRLVTGLNGFIHDVDWAKLGRTLGGRINDLLAILRTAATVFDWTGAGRALATGLNHLFATVDWAGLGDWLNRTIVGLLDFGIAFFQELDVDAFCEGVKTALGRVDWDGVARRLWELLTLALGKLGKAANALLFGGSTDLDVSIGLTRSGWTSLAQFIGTAVTVLANLSREGSNWSGGLLSWFKAAAGGNVVDLVGRLFMKDDSADWWSDVRTWFNRAAGNSRNRLTLTAGMSDTSATWWGDIRGWFSAQAEASGNALSLRAGMTDTSFAWFSDIRRWFDRQGKTPGNALTLRAEVEDTSVKWWSDIRDWFERQGRAVGGALTFTAGVSDTAAQWFADIQRWFARQSKASSNDLRLKVGVSDTSADWWDDIKRWFASQGKNWWNQLEASVGIKDESGTWWGDIKKWFDGQKQYWWNDLNLNAKVENDSGTWWSNVVSWWNGVKQTLGFSVAAEGGSFAAGGYVTDAGRMGAFASGGAITGGRATWWDSVSKYASGTGRAHGTVFVAGEAGPEVVGHVNGRTEILNKSQIAQAIYSAVVSGMGAAVNALGRYLAGHMTGCTNALVRTIGAGRLSAANIAYHAPALATGAVLPYDVAAQIARTGEGIENALDANTEDLIQTIISVVGAQTTALVNALQPRVGRGETLTARQVIGEINRMTQMFGTSPVRG